MLVNGIRIIDLFDILLVTAFFYVLLVWFKRTKSASVFVGFIMSGAIYVLVTIFKLQLSVTIMHSFFAVILVAFIIIFQEEIRRGFENIALFSFRSQREREQIPTGIQKHIEMLTNTLFDFAREHVGALIVLRANDPIKRHIHGGVALQGWLSSAVLKSIFDTHSDGHDGAVIVEKTRITYFGCRLPLSENSSATEKGGTRHAAALGLSEVSDALCLIASEERGIVSYCRFGEMEKVDSREKLTDLLRDFYDELYPDRKSRKNVLRYLTTNLKEKGVALLLAVTLWFVVVHESTVVYRSFTVPIQYVGLSSRLSIEKIEPADVRIVLTAPRRDFYFIQKEDIQVILNLFFTREQKNWNEMKYEAIATASDVRLPQGLNIVNIFPRNIIFHMKPNAPHPENARIEKE